MEMIANQRKLIADLAVQGKPARPEHGLFRELLRTFEGTLAELRQTSDGVIQRAAWTRLVVQVKRLC
jgi:hypothetical protein